jgi:hypothetical protein
MARATPLHRSRKYSADGVRAAVIKIIVEPKWTEPLVKRRFLNSA